MSATSLVLIAIMAVVINTIPVQSQGTQQMYQQQYPTMWNNGYRGYDAPMGSSYNSYPSNMNTMQQYPQSQYQGGSNMQAVTSQTYPVNNQYQSGSNMQPITSQTYPLNNPYQGQNQMYSPNMYQSYGTKMH